MFCAHYHVPNRTVTAPELAEAVGYSNFPTANSVYGKLGRKVAQRVNYQKEDVFVEALAKVENHNGKWYWIMHPQVAEAMERLGWVVDSLPPLPEEVPESARPLVEGAFKPISVNAYERNPEARRLCLQNYGTRCCICGFSFGEVYGEVAEGFIHVHHLRPLSEIGQEYTVDPIADLRPICPNCHAVVHRHDPPFTIEKVQEFLRRRAAE